MKSWLMGILFATVILNSMGCAVAQEESPLVGKRAPDFTLERVRGISASLYELIKGKKAIVFFYATWCQHCRSQIQEIKKNSVEMRKDGIEVLLVNVGEPKSKVLKFLEQGNIDMDSFLDADSFVSQTYQIMGIPTLVFVGADSVIRYVEYGLPENYKEILK